MTAGDLSPGEYRKAKLDILAGIEANLALIVANTGHADVYLATVEKTTTYGAPVEVKA